MGKETANVHLGERQVTMAILDDLQRRRSAWLLKAAEKMAAATEDDWKQLAKGELADGLGRVLLHHQELDKNQTYLGTSKVHPNAKQHQCQFVVSCCQIKDCHASVL
jgi:hypothetical protein